MATSNATNSQDRSKGHSERDQGKAMVHPMDESPDAEVPCDPVAAGLRGFGPLGMIAMLVILLALLVAGNPFVPLSAILVLIWARWSQTPWREIGYARPKSWSATIVVGITF